MDNTIIQQTPTLPPASWAKGRPKLNPRLRPTPRLMPGTDAIMEDTMADITDTLTDTMDTPMDTDTGGRTLFGIYKAFEMYNFYPFCKVLISIYPNPLSNKKQSFLKIWITISKTNTNSIGK